MVDLEAMPEEKMAEVIVEKIQTKIIEILEYKVKIQELNSTPFT